MSACHPSCLLCLAGLCHGCPDCRRLGGAHRVADRKIHGPWAAVVGARAHGNPGQVDEAVEALPKGTVVVSGGAVGVDQQAVSRAKRRGLATVEFEAAWEEHGNGAGMVRNIEILASVDKVIALPWWGCRGTLHMMKEAKKRRIPLQIVRPITKLEVWSASKGDPVTPDDLDITAANNTSPPTKQAVRALLREARRTPKGQGLRQLQKNLIQNNMPSLGAAWAPPWSILGPAIVARRAIDAAAQLSDMERLQREDALWNVYANGSVGQFGFMDVLRSSFKDITKATLWGWAFAQPKIVLRCVCTKPGWWPSDRPWDHCHRFLVGKAMAACGANYKGELF